MEIGHLALFVRAADTLNISAAGKSLGLAPAVASSWLAKLEKELGVELFHRSTRKVSLSIEGEDFLPYAKEILAQAAAGREALGLGAAEIKGTVRFAASSSFAQMYITPLLPALIEAHPGLKLDLRFSDSPFDLLGGSFDLALRNTVLDDSSLKARKLADVSNLFCASKEYLAKHGTPETPADLEKHCLIAFGRMSQCTLVSSAGERASVQFNGENCRATVDDGTSQRMASEAGLGISLNADWSARPSIRDGRLVHILPDWRVKDDVALWLVYPKSNVLTAKVRVLIDFLAENIGRNPPWKGA